MRDQDSATHWDEQAANWTAWARSPGHDVYWSYREQLAEVLPSAGAATLEVGCGEGRISRDLAAWGHNVTGVDTSTRLVEAAREAGPQSRYLWADATDLPFEADSFDLVVSYNMLMDVDDVVGTVNEIARVVRPDGAVFVSITHPIAEAEQFMDQDYLDTRPFHAEVEELGMKMVFAGWRRPLSAYTRAMEDAGLLIESFLEPPGVQTPGSPIFVWIRCRPR